MSMPMSEKAPFTEYRIFGVLGNLAVGELQREPWARAVLARA